jgi:hypothetical protein
MTTRRSFLSALVAGFAALKVGKAETPTPAIGAGYIRVTETWLGDVRVRYTYRDETTGQDIPLQAGPTRITRPFTTWTLHR